MTTLHAALVTPLNGPLSLFGRTCATALTVWTKSAANLPSPWTGIELDVHDTGRDVGAAIRAALETQPDVLLYSLHTISLLVVHSFFSAIAIQKGNISSSHLVGSQECDRSLVLVACVLPIETTLVALFPTIHLPSFVFVPFAR
jgi:hypothetical protein